MPCFLCPLTHKWLSLTTDAFARRKSKENTKTSNKKTADLHFLSKDTTGRPKALGRELDFLPSILLGPFQGNDPQKAGG